MIPYFFAARNKKRGCVLRVSVFFSGATSGNHGKSDQRNWKLCTIPFMIASTEDWSNCVTLPEG
jgi:hypothetical protein